jgi:hypothetical protein
MTESTCTCIRTCECTCIGEKVQLEPVVTHVPLVAAGTSRYPVFSGCFLSRSPHGAPENGPRANACTGRCTVGGCLLQFRQASSVPARSSTGRTSPAPEFHVPMEDAAHGAVASALSLGQRGAHRHHRVSRRCGGRRREVRRCGGPGPRSPGRPRCGRPRAGCRRPPPPWGGRPVGRSRRGGRCPRRRVGLGAAERRPGESRLPGPVVRVGVVHEDVDREPAGIGRRGKLRQRDSRPDEMYSPASRRVSGARHRMACVSCHDRR